MASRNLKTITCTHFMGFSKDTGDGIEDRLACAFPDSTPQNVTKKGKAQNKR